MVIYTSGTVEALVVFKASDGKKGLLWIPSLARKQNYDKLEQYSLGKWLRFDMGADKIVEPMETGPYESHQGSASPLVSGLNTPVPLAEVTITGFFFSSHLKNFRSAHRSSSSRTRSTFNPSVIHWPLDGSHQSPTEHPLFQWTHFATRGLASKRFFDIQYF
jgi:hypothetical protein